MSKLFDIEQYGAVNLLNLTAERLFRQAEDEFFYFSDSKKSLTLLNKILKTNPQMVKAIILKADIKLMQNKFKEAQELYEKAVVLNHKNPRALSSLAACLDMTGNYSLALKYCHLAFREMTIFYMDLYPSLYELKVNLLIKLRKYEKAQNLLDNAVYDLTSEEIGFLKACSQKFLKKKSKLSQRLKISNLKIIY